MKVSSERECRRSFRKTLISGLSLIPLFLLFGTLSSPSYAATVNLDQMRNGSAGSPTNPPAFVNGNAGSSQAHLLEGYSQAYRMAITGLSNGSHQVVIEWDILQSGTHAIDYITHFQRLDPHGPPQPFNHAAETVNPLIGLAGPFGAPSTFPIPAPSSAGTRALSPSHSAGGTGSQTCA